MKFGYFRIDGEGNFYIIPENLIEEFDKMLEFMDGWTYDEWDEVNGKPNIFDSFTMKFDEYRVDGKIYNMKICYFGTYDPIYTRNRLMIQGLKENNVEVVECRVEQQKSKLKK